MAETEPEKEEQPEEKKKGFFQKLVSGLTKTRNSIADSFSSVFAANHIDEDFYEELEEILIMADMGVSTTMNILDELREQVKKQHIKEPKDCKELLVSIIKEQMSPEPNAYEYENKTSVVMVIGVNGVGKTTSIGKLASQFRKSGKKVIMAAADTFRAAAIEQLTEWAHRSQTDIISQKEGADPSAVVFDACRAAKARNADILLIDTAGRLHNKKNLMDELSKMNRIIDREFPEAYRETLIVLDGTTGQNALEQAKKFKQVADIDGIILTKLDGTAKGGIAIAIHAELGVPVKYIGVGEGIDDLQKFDPQSYVNAIFDVTKEDEAQEEQEA
ncbi:MAG: signal recognition particle-docking protein FtsY [Lachnospiraceae bacterium]|nr:signal recognition particle-docking protein FtsY [Lachnospiraceae bacterium]